MADLTIFVSVAAYRDPELSPTVQNCIAMARHPRDLRIVVCWQRATGDTINELKSFQNVQVLDFHWRESQGACWARAKVMELWNGEDFYLQIDSHQRFTRDWDVKLIDQYRRSKSSRPIITTYCQSYSPVDSYFSHRPTKMVVDYFTQEFIPLYRPVELGVSEQPTRPERARFVSAHLLFTSGNFVDQVPYDPRLYFHGEEISLAVRAYTWGYDFFHPTGVILWHQYSRDGRPKHWSDHSVEAAAKMPWHERDMNSRALVAELLTTGSTGRFGCGPNRTLAEYEAYAGIDFRRKLVQDCTLAGLEPPSSSDSQWRPAAEIWTVEIYIERRRLSADAFASAMCWCINAFGPGETEVYHVDLDRDVICGILKDSSPLVVIQLQVSSGREPKTWILNAHSEQYHVSARLRGKLNTKKLP